MRRTLHIPWSILLVTAATLASNASCGGDDDTCTVGTATGCDEGLICEEVVGGTAGCFSPVHIRGRVFDAATSVGIDGATIVARDVNGAARTSVARSAIDGTYSLPIAIPRQSDGTFATENVTLRVDASGYQSFPKAPRTALPIEVSTSQTMEDMGVDVIMNVATDVALIALPGGAAGLGVIEGTIVPAAGGVLVTAEQGGDAVSTAISDTDGVFTIFNVPPGATTVRGFRAGLDVTPVDLTASGALDTVTLNASEDGLATVSGQIQIVNASGGLSTSVILVVESTYDPVAIRGESPAGLRAPNITGAFSITGVPPGRYAVLAAFENDQLVRDPDEGISGTDVVFIDVAGADLTLDQSFKVTEALAVVSPGADEIETVSGTPTFVWADDSSEDGYEVRVYDAFGELVHENTMIPSVSGSGDVSYEWTGATLEPGMIYQFRAWSFRAPGGGTRSYISATEDLRGVFTAAP